MFGAGDFASDMAVSTARNEATRLSRSLQQANDNITEMNEANAANLGLRCALEEQLRKVDPTHPLLKDTSLIERIKAAAISGFYAVSRNFDGAREVGRTFKIPGRENGPVVTPAAPKAGLAMRDDVTKLKHEYAGLVALRDALLQQLLKSDPTNPMFTDFNLQMKVRLAGQTAFILNGEDFESARNAGRTFAIPGRE